MAAHITLQNVCVSALPPLRRMPLGGDGSSAGRSGSEASTPPVKTKRKTSVAPRGMIVERGKLVEAACAKHREALKALTRLRAELRKDGSEGRHIRTESFVVGAT